MGYFLIVLTCRTILEPALTPFPVLAQVAAESILQHNSDPAEPPPMLSRNWVDCFMRQNPDSQKTARLSKELQGARAKDPDVILWWYGYL